MSDYTTNYMSNAARMIGFTMGGTRIHIDNLKTVINNVRISKADRTAMLFLLKRLERKQDIIELWWEKRGEENVSVEALEVELDHRDTVQLERA
jgi:uncharacterized protein (DUF1786 family)